MYYFLAIVVAFNGRWITISTLNSSKNSCGGIGVVNIEYVYLQLSIYSLSFMLHIETIVSFSVNAVETPVWQWDP